jgi:hypothetical protein
VRITRTSQSGRVFPKKALVRRVAKGSVGIRREEGGRGKG